MTSRSILKHMLHVSSQAHYHYYLSVRNRTQTLVAEEMYNGSTLPCAKQYENSSWPINNTSIARTNRGEQIQKWHEILKVYFIEKSPIMQLKSLSISWESPTQWKLLCKVSQGLLGVMRMLTLVHVSHCQGCTGGRFSTLLYCFICYFGHTTEYPL